MANLQQALLVSKMVKVCSDEFLMYLFDLFTSIWDSIYLLVFGIAGVFLGSGEVPLWSLYLRREISYWWRSSLLDVWVSFFAKITQQQHLQVIVE